MLSLRRSQDEGWEHGPAALLDRCDYGGSLVYRSLKYGIMPM